MIMVDKAKEANLTFAKGLSYLWNLSKKNDLDRFGFKKAAAHLVIVGGIPCLITYESGIMTAIVLSIGTASTVHAWHNEYKEDKNDTYGDARFAKSSELKKAKLIGKTGLFFGKVDGKFITKPEAMEGHVLVIGPPGSGKTSGFVIPSLWRWKDSAFIFDPKGGELADKTSVFRSRFQKVYVFNPFGEKCDQYNPIEHCKTTDEALSMAEILIPKQSKENAYWEEMARSVVAAAIFEGYLNKRTLVEVCKFICLNEMEQLKKYYLNHSNEKVKLLASPLRHLKDKTESYVMSDLMRSLNTIAGDDHIEASTSRSDWDLNELKDRATIYLSIPEEKLKLPQYQKLLNIIINQAVDHLSSRQEMKKDDKRPRILFMIDELPTLGHIPSLLQSLATLRSRGVTLSLAFQSMSQLDELYKTNGRKTIMDICPFKLVFGVEDPETQKYFSDRAGTKTIRSKSISRYSEDFDQYNISESETSSPLVRPSEWSNLEKPVLFTPLKYPAEIEIIKYWKDFQLNKLMRRDLKKAIKYREQKEAVMDVMEEIVGFEEEAEIKTAERREAK